MRALLDKPKQAVKKLEKLKVGALFMEAGTAKTSAAVELVRSSNTDYCLWFTPFNTKQNLRDEINKCGGLGCEIIGIESIQNSDRIYLDIYNKVQKANKAFIVCDESLKIKNYEAKRTQRLIELSKISEYRLVLNGTPISRNLLDLWPQMEFLSPKILGMRQAEFKNTFCEYTQISKIIAHKKYTKEWINKYHNIDYLYSLIELYIFEAELKLNVGIQYLDISFNLTEDEKANHEYIKEKYLDNEILQAKNNNIFLEITQKLQHNYSLSPEKLEICRKIISEHDKNHVLICAKYVDSQEYLKKHFPEIRILSWQKDSFALNLQDYNVIIEWDKHWDYALFEQLWHRVYREGQKKDCFYYKLNGDVGLESMMNKNQDKKGKLLKAFKNKTINELQKEL